MRFALAPAVVIAASGLWLAACSSTTPSAPGSADAQSADRMPAASATPSGSSSVPPPSELVDAAAACVARLPLDVRIGQTMLVTTTDLPRVQPWLEDGLIAGLLANGRLSRATASALEVATSGTRYGALLAADEEGGPVARYADVIGEIPSAQRQAATMTPEEVRAMYAEHGQALADWGVDLVFAPVVDVGHGPGIGPRSYSDDPDVVTEYGTAAAQGYAEGGLLPVLKHFPGHGSATADTHYEVAVGPPIDQLREVDLVPFKEIPSVVDVGVMVGHTTIPGYSDTPASQSARTIEGLLVDELGFEGLIVSDALGMAASGQPTQGDALVGFIAAGGDLGIVGPGGSQEGRRALRKALKDGTVSRDRLNDAAATVLAVKGMDPCQVAGQPAPEVSDESDAPSDGPVINPTEEP